MILDIIFMLIMAFLIGAIGSLSFYFVALMIKLPFTWLKYTFAPEKYEHYIFASDKFERYSSKVGFVIGALAVIVFYIVIIF